MKETNHPSSLATCTLIQDFLGVKDGGIYEAVVKQKQRLDAVVAECAVVKSLNSKLCDELRGYETDNEDFGPAPQSLALAYSTETHAVDAALAEVEAKAIEKALAVVTAFRENICPGGLSENRQYEESIVQPHLDGIADELENLIVELREAR